MVCGMEMQFNDILCPSYFIEVCKSSHAIFAILANLVLLFCSLILCFFLQVLVSHPWEGREKYTVREMFFPFQDKREL